MADQHTPGPWTVQPDIRDQPAQYGGPDVPHTDGRNVESASGEIVGCEGILGDGEDNDRLIAAAPEMLEALHSVNKLISEAAMTGFNCHDGDWAERLFFSQQATSDAIRKAKGRL